MLSKRAEVVKFLARVTPAVPRTAKRPAWNGQHALAHPTSSASILFGKQQPQPDKYKYKSYGSSAATPPEHLGNLLQQAGNGAGSRILPAYLGSAQRLGLGQHPNIHRGIQYSFPSPPLSPSTPPFLLARPQHCRLHQSAAGSRGTEIMSSAGSRLRNRRRTGKKATALYVYPYNNFYSSFSNGGGGGGGGPMGRRWLAATPDPQLSEEEGGSDDDRHGARKRGNAGSADDDDGMQVERKKTTKMAKTIKTLRDTKEEAEHNLNYVDLLDDDKQSEGDAAPSEPWLKRAGTSAYWAETWGHVKHEARHYWYGAKLLVTDTMIAARFLTKALKGQQLTRRERKQFTRTLADLVRLVPMFPFVIIPGAELLLPFAIKIFPNMLPTQFRHADTEMKKQRANLRVRIEMAKFLQETVEEMAVTTSKRSKDKGKKDDGADSKHGLAELAKMFEEGRTHARDIPTAELLKFSKLFDDVLTLDSLSHAHLVAFAKLLGLPTMGTSAVLNFQIRMQLRMLHADDFLILKEGIETMSVSALQDACRARGMRAAGISEEGLQERLSQWINLHIVEDVPASLLLMSRVLYLPENLAPEAQLATVLDSLPENIKDEVKVAAAESEAIEVEPEAKLVLLANEEALIEEELAELKAAEERATAKEEALAAEQRQAELDAVSTKVQPGVENEVWEKYSKSQEELDQEAAVEAAEKVEAAAAAEADKMVVTAEELQELVADVVLDEKATRAAIETLRGDLEEDYALIREAKALELEVDTPKSTKQLMKQVGSMVSKLEDNFEETLKLPDGSVILDANGDGVVSREELVMAFKKMDKTGEVTEAQIRNTVMLLDRDDDGSIPLQTIEKVIDMIVQEGDKIDASALRTIVEVVEKEHKLEVEIARYDDEESIGNDGKPSVGASSSGDGGGGGGGGGGSSRSTRTVDQKGYK